MGSEPDEETWGAPTLSPPQPHTPQQQQDDQEQPAAAEDVLAHLMEALAAVDRR